MSTFRYRMQRYNPTTGAVMGPGPIPRSVDASSPLNDIPGLSATFSDPQNIIRAPAELAIELSFDDGQTWTEPPNMRYAVLGDTRDRIKTPKFPSIKAVGMFWQLKKAVIHAESGPLDADGRRAWSSITPGALVRTLVQEAQARGVLPWLSVSSFSSTHDSNGTLWPSVFSTSHNIGVGYDSVIITLADVGLIDFEMVGRSLRMYVADTYLAPASTGITLVEGQDFTEGTEEVTYELVASRNLILGEGISTVVTDGAADKPWGEWEVTTSASGSSTLADLNLLADLGSARSSLRQTQRTFTVYPNRSAGCPKPWLDYKVGDKLAAFTDGTLETDLRVRQLTLRGDGASALATLVLGDRLLEREVRLNRLMKAASGGIAGAGAGGTFPSQPEGAAETVAPSPPTSIGFSSTAVLINDAIVADLTISWTAPTTNENATILDDLSHFEVQTKRTALGASYWEAGGTTELTVLTVGALVPGASYDARVRAVDKNGNFSTWLTGTYTTNQDGVAPQQPSTPTVVADLGIIFVYWDGKDNLGNNPPNDFRECQVHVSTTSGFTPDATTYKDSITAASGGRSPIGDVTYGTTYFVKLVAVDTSGNASTPSTQASGTPSRVTGLDIEALTIETSNMGDLIVTSAKMADLAVINAKIANLAVDDAKIANMSVGKLTVGTLSADITVAARIKTANIGARAEINSSGFQAYNSSNVLTFDVSSSTGNVTVTGIFRTGLSGQRIVIDDTGNGTIYFYPATGADYAFINAPSQNSVGVNSGNGGGANRTRLFVTPTMGELLFMNGTTQAQTGGRVWVDDGGVWMNGLAGDTCQMSVTSGGTVFAGSGSSEMNIGSTNKIYVTTTVAQVTVGSGDSIHLDVTSGASLDLDTGVSLTGSTGDIFCTTGGGYGLFGISSNRYLEFSTSTTLKHGNNSSTVYTGTTIEEWATAYKIVNIPSGTGTTLIINNHQVYAQSSSRLIKEQIEDIDEDRIINAVMQMRPITYYDKKSYEEADGDTSKLSWELGVIAEEVKELDLLGELLFEERFDTEGNAFPPGVTYRAVAVALIPVVQRLWKDVQELKAQLA